MKTFTTYDTYAEFNRQGHNHRTRNAWEYGVKLAARGNRCHGGRLIYQRASRDYATAEVAGLDHARARLATGERWECSECHHVHEEDPAP